MELHVGIQHLVLDKLLAEERARITPHFHSARRVADSFCRRNRGLTAVVVVVVVGHVSIFGLAGPLNKKNS